METAQETIRTSQNQREVILDLPHPLPPSETGPLQTIPPPQARKAGLDPGATYPGGW